MSKPKAPKAPDPVATAQAQTQSNTETARLSNQLNRVNQVGPNGSVTYSNNGDNWTQTTALSPNQQALQTGQEQLGIGLNDLAGSQIKKVQDILGTNFTPRRFNSADVTGGALDINKELGNYSQQVEDDTYKLATDRLGTQFGREEQDLRSQLANQGITAGSEGFTGEMAGFNEGKGNAYSNARLNARQVAMATRDQQLGEVMGQRQQNLAEGEADYGRNYAADLAQRQQPLNEISSIMSGTPLIGQDPGSIYTRGVSDTDVAGITQNGYNNQLAAYQQQMSGRNAALGGLFGLGGAALGNTSLFK